MVVNLEDVAVVVNSILKTNEDKKIFPGICPGGIPKLYEIRSRTMKGFKEPKLFSFYYPNGSVAEIVIDVATRGFISGLIQRQVDNRTDTLLVNGAFYLTSEISWK